MKFEKNGLKFEVSNLDHIVINTVRQVIKPAVKGKPARVTNEKERANGDKGTRVWIKFDFEQGRTRWLKYHDVVTSEATVLDPKAAQEYASHKEIRDLIDHAMQRQDIRVWFSGTYCNIEICENWQEVQKIKAQEAKRKTRSRAAKILRSPNIGNILQDAIQKSAAHLRQESIDTPFGPVPVMTIRGSGRRN